MQILFYNFYINDVYFYLHSGFVFYNVFYNISHVFQSFEVITRMNIFIFPTDANRFSEALVMKCTKVRKCFMAPEITVYIFSKTNCYFVETRTNTHKLSLNITLVVFVLVSKTDSESQILCSAHIYHKVGKSGVRHGLILTLQFTDLFLLHVPSTCLYFLCTLLARC